MDQQLFEHIKQKISDGITTPEYVEGLYKGSNMPVSAKQMRELQSLRKEYLSFEAATISEARKLKDTARQELLNLGLSVNTISMLLGE